MMRRTTSIRALAEGLGALRVLASLGPTTTETFASEADLEPGTAEALVQVFLETGYAARIRTSALLTITPLARTILSCREQVGEAEVRESVLLTAPIMAAREQ